MVFKQQVSGLKKSLFLVSALVSILVIFVFSLPAQALSAENASKKIVTELIEAMDANDAERISGFFSDDASQAYGNGTPKSGDAFRRWLQSDIIGVKGRVADPVIKADGNSVVVTGEYRNANGYTSKADFLLTVEDGKIISWTMRY